MKVKLLILDLDNTIYPVPSLGQDLFAPLLRIISEDPAHTNNMEPVIHDIMRIPFQKVASRHGFSKKLTERGAQVLQEIEYKGPIEAFEDFHLINTWKGRKYLVTTGFPKMQQSKIDGLRLNDQFDGIRIVDPSTSDLTKKDAFADIMQMEGLTNEETLVVGDDPDSEIRAADELGIPAIIYDKYGTITDPGNHRKIDDYGKLLDILHS